MILEKKRKPSPSKMIETGIPIPKYTKMPKVNPFVEDLKALKPGQSRIIDVEYNEKNLNAVRTRVYTIRVKEKLMDRKFTINMDPVTEKKMRIWRVQ